MRFEKVVPTSNYYYYIGGERIDDPAAMARFRDKGIVQYYTGYHETEYWSEPDGAEFDRIDFPDKTHCRILWARGGRDAFDVSREDGMMKLTSNVWQESSFIMYLPEMMRYAAPRCSPSTGYLYSLYYWGRFTSERRFEMLWTQIRWQAFHSFVDMLCADMLTQFSDVVAPAKIGMMGPKDTLVVRHYKVVFTRYPVC